MMGNPYSEMRLSGFLRPDGQWGVRNHVIAVASVACANRVVEMLGVLVPAVVPITHGTGCALTGTDRERVFRTLVGTALNPNVYAVLVVGLGCETVQPEALAEEIGRSGKPTELVLIQEGGTGRAVSKGLDVVRMWVEEASRVQRRAMPWEALVVGTECGGSDATSGLAANPVVGAAVDVLVDLGATVILSETTEVIGAEHLLAERGGQCAAELLQAVRRCEQALCLLEVDIRGGQPTPGNMAGGITTLEEKALGAIAKGGSTPLREVLEYAVRPHARGLVFMDTPGYDVESVCGMVAGGAQVVLFTTGRGTPLGNPVAPVIKVTGNPATAVNMRENIDFDVSDVLKGRASVSEMAGRLVCLLAEVCSGRMVRAECLGHREFGISRLSRSL